MVAHIGTSQVAQYKGIYLPMQETQELRVQSLGQEDPLEKEMPAHSSILAWEISWTEETDELQSMGVTKSWTRLSDFTYFTYNISSCCCFC